MIHTDADRAKKHSNGNCSSQGKAWNIDRRTGRGGDYICGRRGGRTQRHCGADRFVDADGDHSPGQAHGWTFPLIKDFVPLAELNDLVFGGWDIFTDSAYEAAANAKVLEKELLLQLKPFLDTIKPMPAVFDHEYVKLLDGPNVKKGKNKLDLAEQLRADIRNFKKENQCDRLVMIWCASTESFQTASEVHALGGSL